MKIAFVNPNIQGEYARPPLGLLSVATVCKEAGHEVKIIDANLLHLNPLQIKEAVGDWPVVGLTAMTPAINEAIGIANVLRDKVVILGGVHASVFPEECYQTGVFDVIVTGEGEGKILEVLEDIENGILLDNIYRNDEPDTTNITIPDYSLIPIDKYRARYPHMVSPPWTIASTSRGCRYRCTFCYRGVSGNHYHAMPASQMIELIRNLQDQFGIRDITFYDDLFTWDKERVLTFCKDIIRNRIYLTWTCESRVSQADPVILDLMYRAGCRLVYYGLESGNQGILNNLKKGIRLDLARQCVKLTQEAGIKVAGYFMLGCPGETPETIQDTINFARLVNVDHAQFSICSPLPGSELYSQYVAKYPRPDWSEFCYLGGNGSKPMFTTEEISRQYLEQVVEEQNKYYRERAEEKA